MKKIGLDCGQTLLFIWITITIWQIREIGTVDIVVVSMGSFSKKTILQLCEGCELCWQRCEIVVVQCHDNDLLGMTVTIIALNKAVKEVSWPICVGISVSLLLLRFKTEAL